MVAVVTAEVTSGVVVTGEVAMPPKEGAMVLGGTKPVGAALEGEGGSAVVVAEVRVEGLVQAATVAEATEVGWVVAVEEGHGSGNHSLPAPTR